MRAYTLSARARQIGFALLLAWVTSLVAKVAVAQTPVNIPPSMAPAAPAPPGAAAINVPAPANSPTLPPAGVMNPVSFPDLELKVGGGKGDWVSTLRLLGLLTLLTLAPGILLTMTCFTRIIIVMSFLRQALGTQQSPPNQVMMGLSLFMTIFIMGPTFTEVHQEALVPYLAETISQDEALERATKPVKGFMLRETRQKDLALFIQASGAESPAGPADVGMMQLVPAFIISELKTAFQMGFMIFVPFLVLDMVVASVLMAMGMMMLPPVLISLPFKLMLFVLVDGWNLLAGSLIRSFTG